MAADPARQREAGLIRSDVHVEEDQGNPPIGMQGAAGFSLAEGLDDIVAPLAQVGCRFHAQQEVVLHDHDPIARRGVIGRSFPISRGHLGPWPLERPAVVFLFCDITTRPPTLDPATWNNSPAPPVAGP